MWPNAKKTADLVTFTGEIDNGKPHFWCSVCSGKEEVLRFLDNCRNIPFSHRGNKKMVTEMTQLFSWLHIINNFFKTLNLPIFSGRKLHSSV